MGVKAIVIGSLIDTFICYFINAYYPGKLFGYGAWKQIKDWRYIFLSLFIMAAIVILYLHCVSNVWIQFIGGGIVGGITYIICCIKFKLINKELIYSLKKH